VASVTHFVYLHFNKETRAASNTILATTFNYAFPSKEAVSRGIPKRNNTTKTIIISTDNQNRVKNDLEC
jgi:hypothetical protein